MSSDLRCTRRSFAATAAALAGAACTPGIRRARPAAMIVVDQPMAMTDVPVRIELKGFPARTPVTLTATLRFPSGARWQSLATFMTDDAGIVDVSRQAPTSGTYEGVAPMGFIWSAERSAGPTGPLATDFVTRPWLIDVEAEAADGTRTATTLERRLMAPGVTRHMIRTAGIVGTLFLPAGDGPHPALIVLTGGNGGLDEPMAAIFASRGYAALALAYFRAEGLPRGLVNIPLEYFETAIRWMRAQPWLRDRLLAVWGPSRGGELALLLGATFPEINAVIAAVPSGVVFWALGLAEAGDIRPRASWTYRGKPLPYLQEGNPGDTSATADRSRPIAFSTLYRSQLRDTRAVERATIPVENTRGPILLVSGTDDQMWPSSDLADIAMRRLEQH